MKALLIKDVLVQKPNMILGAVYSLLLFALLALARAIENPGFVYALTGIGVGGMITLGSLGGDKNDSVRFTLSLPVTRVQAVTGKYVLLLLATIYGTGFAALFGALLSLPGIDIVPMGIRGLDLLRIAVGMLIMTFTLPFYFRFGYLMIRYLIIGLLVLGVVLQVVAMLVITLSSGSSRRIVLFDWIMDLYKNGDPIRNNLILLGIGAAICVLSYVVSMIIYTRKDL
jgi:hypothetical protein